ncbi:hypothetical protein LZC95_49765 [Pendulispora brunnea]|uniref:Insecticide toxin TcdB middle/N-terminal domain-containing protein n=1 Tax=Pendulispora brunnea TaxID=2905690 RepID=A0ABZ2KDR5_9BACT
MIRRGILNQLQSRRRAAPVAFATAVSYLATLAYPLSAAAQEVGESAATPARAEPAEAPVRAAPERGSGEGGAATAESNASPPEREKTSAPTAAMAAGATGSDTGGGGGGNGAGGGASGLSLPSGAGTTQGMGESFSAQLSTGTASYGLAIELPTARGAVQPHLVLSYSSGAGSGVLGIGWNLGTPFIARQTDHSPPRYLDPVAGGGWTPSQDSFTFNGAELVPICLVGAGGACSGKLPDEVMPVWAGGWQYFRTRIEGSFQRFFWSPDRLTWRVQDKNGTSMELGVPLDGSGDRNALETDGGSRVFRWNIARAYDTAGETNAAAQAQPRPFNVVAYRYLHDGGIAYPSDIYDTPPATNPAAPLAAFAHHAHLDWTSRPDGLSNFRRGWEVRQGLRLSRIDVASKPFANALSAPRHQLRRYRLAYDPGYHASLLTRVQVEGRCADTEDGAPSEGADGVLPPSSCPMLPPVTLSYSHAQRGDGTPVPTDPSGFEGFDDTVRAVNDSPAAGFDNAFVDFYDVNADALPDVLDTEAVLHQGRHAVYIQGTSGKADTFGPVTPLSVSPTSGIDSATLSFNNPNVLPLDLDGDGIGNLVHLAVRQTPVVFKPVRAGSAFAWAGREVARNTVLDPTIDFSNQRGQVRIVDANNDGFVDFVVSGTTQLQTFFSLSRLPGGDGRFGSGSSTGSATAQLSAAPVTACAPFSGGPVFFDQSDVKTADANGDGLVDIVRVRNGNVIYWPGRGDGTWGTGDLSNCRDGFLGEDRLVAMSNSPLLPGADDALFQMSDVNGDGLSDVIYSAHDGVTVWLNMDGVSWSGARFVSAPPTSQVQSRMVDINGSGTADVVWPDAYHYRYIDLLGGSRPWLLTSVDNGLGKTTSIEYSTSTAEMLAALKAGAPWSQTSPTVSHVVKRMTMRDNLDRVGRTPGAYVTEYTYRDPVYDGRQREFRGFKTATERKVGDANSPSSTTQSTFLAGECTEEGIAGRCSDDARWRDNPREALKGLPVVTEIFDDGGVYQSTEHTTYRLRHLYTGLDGRAVRYAFVSRKNTYLYDTAAFTPATANVTTTDVELELAPPLSDGSPSSGGIIQDTTRALTLRSTAGRVTLERESWSDAHGNPTRTRDDGCVDGCGAADEAITTEMISARVPGDDSGWLWRTTNTFVVGSSAPTERRDHTAVAYDSFGRATSRAAALSGSLPLDRFHQSGAAVAPPPMTASVDGTVQIGATAYDPLGNIVKTTAAGGRCETLTTDEAYGQLVVTQTTFAGVSGTSGCGPVALASTAQYDRALAKMVTLTGPNHDEQRATYDAFGRTQAQYRADPATGAAQTTPAVVYEYDLPADPRTRPYALVRTQTQTGTSSSPRLEEQWDFVDGMGRTMISLAQADPSAGDGGDWIASGFTKYDTKGAVAGLYRPSFWSGVPTSFPVGTVPSTGIARERYDAFGHVVLAYAPDGSPRLRTVHHALSEDLWDGADLAQGPHAGTFSSIARDGHGRVRVSTERIHAGSNLEARETLTEYLPSGEPTKITRMRVGASDPPVVRWMRYDTMGRRVLNVDPNASRNFSSDPNTDPSFIKAWRYAYDDAGQLVGTSDPRGCGANFIYDTAGRRIAEDYSPCLENQPAYSAVDPVTGDGAEAFNVYDAPVASTAGSDAACGNGAGVGFRLGRLTASFSLADVSVASFDARGRVICSARQVAKPGTASAELSSRYAPRWYATTSIFDEADRAIVSSTGARSTDLLGTSGDSMVSVDYSLGGRVKAVGSSYGPLLTKAVLDAEGHPLELDYGDRAGTKTEWIYDGRMRVQSVQTYRGPASIWTSPIGSYQPPGPGPSTLQKILEDRTLRYDEADNPVEIRDDRVADEWPSGAKPISRTMTYDDLYRVVSVSYASGNDAWTPPFEAEAKSTERTRPMPFVAFPSRIKNEQYSYDWLGNVVQSKDDASGFYDRSLGTQTHGTAENGPYQLRHASNRDAGGALAGDLDAAYDDAGNLTTLIVLRDGPCMPSSALCGQRFGYEWDEVGRLAHAWRWDLTGAERAGQPSLLTGAPPSRTPDATLHFAYDASGARVRKTSVESNGAERHAIYVFSSLELRRSTWTGDDYELDATTEVPYLFGPSGRLARVVYAEASAPTVSGSRQHVFLELAQTLGSTGIVIDRETSELVEAATYQAYGAAESDYRPARWNAFREDYRFTGKEDDIELGLTYFGQRYYAPALGRWISVDPMAIHELKADPNLYAYVHGRTFASVDPNGTCEIVCAVIVIGALLAGAITAYMEGTANGTESFDSRRVDVGDVLIATGSAALGGAAGVAAGAAVVGLFGAGAAATAEGAALGAVTSGVVGSAVNSISYRATHAAYHGESVSDSLNGNAIGREAAMGGMIALAGYGVSAGLQYAASRAAPRVPATGGAPETPGTGVGTRGGPLPTEKVVAGEITKENFHEPMACPPGGCGGPGVCFVAGTPVATETGLVAIEDLRVGDRVEAGNTACEADHVEADWVHVRLQMPNPRSPWDLLNIELLRPSDWFAKLGGHGTIWVDFPEMDVSGFATVISVAPAPAEKAGHGCLVLMTVSHVASELLRLTFEETSETVELTPGHRLYVRGQGWVRAADLAPGARLRSDAGDVTVRLVDAAPGNRPVFNLEVGREHAYRVLDSRIWSHNNDCPGINPSDLPSRSGAFNQAKKDLGLPRAQQPDAVKRIPMTDRDGNRILNASKQPIMTREYTYTRPDGSKVVIQDHSAGHQFGEGGVGDQGAHFNVRPIENTRTGHVPGTLDHYLFNLEF